MDDNWPGILHSVVAPGSLAVAAAIAATTLALVLLERRGGTAARYLRKEVLVDVEYTALYKGGLILLLWIPFLVVLRQLLRAFGLEGLTTGLSRMPPFAQMLTSFVILDFIGYWKHRLLHASGLLWRIHSVHHSQRELNPLTLYRVHFLELHLMSALTFFTAQLLGLRTTTWLPFVVVLEILSLLQHSGRGWSYGPLDRILVSPGFHRVHHSIAVEHHDSNFGMILSIWDYLFGTARVVQGELRYGIEEAMPEGFLRQLFHPFRPERAKRPLESL